MRAVRCVPGGVSVLDADEPADDAGEFVQVTAVGICASDLRYIKRGSEQIIGHEIAGVLEDGTPVAVEGMFGCGTCEWCARGNYNLCARGTIDVLGLSTPGGMAELFRAPRRVLRRLPAGLATTDACLVEPGAVAWHCCRSGGVGPDTRVAVVGAGAIGLLAIAAAQTLGADEVAIEARHPHQRELAQRFGASEPSGMYDVVIDAAGTESSLHRGIELARPGATMATVGVFPPDITWPYMAAFAKEVRTVPSIGYCGHDDVREFDKVAGMLASRPQIAEALITHRFDIEDAVHAFDVASDRRHGTLKVVVHP